MAALHICDFVIYPDYVQNHYINKKSKVQYISCGLPLWRAELLL